MSLSEFEISLVDPIKAQANPSKGGWFHIGGAVLELLTCRPTNVNFPTSCGSGRDSFESYGVVFASETTRLIMHFGCPLRVNSL
jgi:hypothetical protein